MRYKIEYLANLRDEHSTCHTSRHDDLTEAEKQAWTGASRASVLFGAHGFQIRDMQEAGEIVSAGQFERPP
jgi:hypothetical protein